MVRFIIYGDNKFFQSKIRLSNELTNLGYETKIFGPEDLDEDFKTRFVSILGQRRIGGYGIWRPYIIRKELDRMKEGDFLIYIDAGCSINSNGKQRINEYLNMLEKSEYGIISFEVPHIEREFTTKQVFEYFDADESIQNSNQLMDTVLIMKKCDHLEKVVDLWLKAVYDFPEMFTDCFNSKQASYFKDHRHEQSVLSVIRKIHGSIVLDDETWFPQFGSEKSLKYPFWATRIKC